MKKLGLLPRLFAAILAGIVLGSTGIVPLVKIMATFNSIFGNFLGFVIPLIIVGFVAPGIADLGKKANNIFLSTVALAYTSTVVAGLLAFFTGKTLLPKVVDKLGVLSEQGGTKITPYFTIEMPAVMGVMTALVLAFVLGLGMANLKEKNLFNAMSDLQKVISGLISKFVIPLIPVHIAGIFSKITAEGKLFPTIKAFSSIFALILLLQASYVVIQYVIVNVYTGKSLVKSIKNMLPAYFTAIGTQSSAATIPVSLECSRNNEVEEDVVDFVVPLCATIHLAGDTIALVVGSMGFLMGMGVDPTLSMMFPFILMLGVTMVAAPGIPGGGVMAALGLLENMLSFGASQQALMIALHFSQDSFGTATNVTGDGAIALIVNKISKKASKEEVDLETA